ncbi:MAG: 50S ribosomal protein L24 [Eubacteriales bacterium]|nr:50S ribosomal protein L24 [Bacillota bacterium]MBV1728184.1 50S ribosomal protein L24 [Desulforudis sp.]MDP3050660.1 50S ribosomal protein L24 [Eubacteriales bacterium]MDQ7789998.1 50S ribosomal protein L24 [Clostridia bacterium]MBU4533903.1 50S ribosomal protein L24 [Bacillota bacterium]
MAKVNVKTGDQVVVITGKDAGKKGKVIEVFPSTNRVIIEGINVVKRHSRPTRKLPQGGIQEKEAPLHSSNVMLLCNKCHKPTRVSRRVLDDGSRVRACKKCKEILG